MRNFVFIFLSLLIMLTTACRTTETSSTRSDSPPTHPPLSQEAYPPPALPEQQLAQAAPTTTPLPTPTIPPTETPPPMATPRPLLLDLPQTFNSATQEWLSYENRELGIRFQYPPDYPEIRIQTQDDEILLDIFRKQQRPDGVPSEEYFVSLSLIRDKHVSQHMETPQAVFDWLQSSSFSGHVGGRMRVVKPLKFKQWDYAWYLLWEPLWFDWNQPVHTVMLVKGDLVVLVSIGDLTYGNVTSDELWQRQMYFLQTVEPLQ
ncbi:MAG: hypothetical protein D6802_10360 [Ardenticatenia bacterium]|nr:MAG: hypothetical protein D6802_10360 [Ardenticatenia bacterium]